jgi:hypothetical protein
MKKKLFYLVNLFVVQSLIITFCSAQNDVPLGPPSAGSVNEEFDYPTIHWFEIDENNERSDLTYKENGKYVIERNAKRFGFYFLNNANNSPNASKPYISQVLDSLTIVVTTDSAKPVEIAPDKIYGSSVPNSVSDKSIDLSKKNKEGFIIWVRAYIKLPGKKQYIDESSFIFKRFELRLLIDLKSSGAEQWASILETGTKAQVKLVTTFDSGNFNETLISGYVPIFHWDRKHDSFLNTIIDNINVGISIPFKVENGLQAKGWGVGLGIWTTKENKSAVQFGVLFPKKDFIDHKVFFMGFDPLVTFDLLVSTFKE